MTAADQIRRFAFQRNLSAEDEKALLAILLAAEARVVAAERERDAARFAQIVAEEAARVLREEVERLQGLLSKTKTKEELLRRNAEGAFPCRHCGYRIWQDACCGSGRQGVMCVGCRGVDYLDPPAEDRLPTPDVPTPPAFKCPSCRCHTGCCCCREGHCGCKENDMRIDESEVF